MAKPFTRLTGETFARTLASKFNPLADSLRDLLTRFGLRGYQVRLVKTRWSGGRRGSGVELVESETLIEPTPKVADLSGIDQVIQPIGAEEIGGLMVTQIPGRYTEEELLGLTSDGSPPDGDQQFYWEVEFLRLGGGAVKRRFVPKGIPSYFPGRLQWQIHLERAHQERNRLGDP